MAFGFLALGVHKPGGDVVARGDVGTPPGGNRAEQVQVFVAAYRAKYGRDPSFSDVRDGLGLPASTASKYRARAIA